MDRAYTIEIDWIDDGSCSCYNKDCDCYKTKGNILGKITKWVHPDLVNKNGLRQFHSRDSCKHALQAFKKNPVKPVVAHNAKNSKKVWKFSANSIMTWGKHAGKKVQWIMENDPQYILWVSRTIFNISIKYAPEVEAYFKLHHNVVLHQYREAHKPK